MTSSNTWPDEVDEILGGDQAVVLATTTPAAGVVLTPMTNFGIRDRDRGTIAPVSSSIGLAAKLDRLERHPQVAVAFHTRTHGFSRRPEFALVQGRARRPDGSADDWMERHRDAWERFAGPRDVGWLWERWLRIYHHRVGLGIDVVRILVWPDLDCRGRCEVHGAPLPAGDPAPQAAPGRGTGPRVDHVRAARRVAGRPNRLLGWVGADGLPVVVPVAVAGTRADGIVVRASTPLPPGGRRAGLVGHAFARYAYGQHQRIHTGWLHVDGADAVYAPHTERGHVLPPSRTAYRLSAGLVTRRGHRAARDAAIGAR